MERRLSAILAADVVGYSRLIARDEGATLDALARCRDDVLVPGVARHGGRIVKHTGDGVLAEFASVVEALNAALAIQRHQGARNAPLPQDRRLELRIGINIGDVVLRDGDIFGDGVNIAARIEALARPGGIAVSGSARDHIGSRVPVRFEDAGPQALKNIEAPVRVFHVVDGPAAEGGAQPDEAAKQETPSIAVLPFNNMSGDPEQEYFSDGIAEDIITDLSKLSGLRVIARNSSFTYKGKAVDVQEVSRRFGVRAVLEGSVRKAGSRVRVTAQLIAGRDGSHLWADRFDRDLTDIFAIQDEITQRIVDELKVRLLPDEVEELASKATTDVTAYELFLKARQLSRLHTRQALHEARACFSEAIARDTGFARAYAGLANCYVYLGSWHREDVAVGTILGLAGYALSLDPGLAEAKTAQAYALYLAGHPDRARAAFDEALALGPRDTEVCFAAARFAFARGETARAAELFRRAMESDPNEFRSVNLLRKCLARLGQVDEAAAAAALTLARSKDSIDAGGESVAALQAGACALAALGDRDGARAWIERALGLDPDDHNSRFNAACTYALLGDRSTAAHHLRDYLAPLGPDEHDWCRHDPDLAGLLDEVVGPPSAGRT
ncbi:adenylate/guanylate cyclase domain-containing protein [Alsobacter sp. R-9]